MKLVSFLALAFIGFTYCQEPFVQESETYDWRSLGGILWNDADTPGELHLYQYYERRLYVDVPIEKANRGWYGKMVEQQKKQFDIKTYEEIIYSVQLYPTPESKRAE